MIHISKHHAPKKMTEQVTSLKAEEAWKRATDTDTETLRGYFNRLDKDIVRKELCQEQHGICAYCMRRIHDDESMSIEHWQPIKAGAESKEWRKDLALDYNNMLGCCDGGRKSDDQKKTLSCDAAKGDRIITLNPLKKEHMDKIVYRTDGVIGTRPYDEMLEHDINDVLHLNGKLDVDGRIMHDTSTGLVMGRREVYEDYVCLMERLGRKYGDDEKRIRKEIEHLIQKLEEASVYQQFVGVWLFFLRRRVRYCQ